MVSAIDICNRALQKLGSPKITSLTEATTRAQAVNACYDIIRRYELRRSVWVFSIRTAAVRAVATTTRTVTFAAWAVGTTYKINDIVTGSDGQVWMSLAGANLAHDPTTSSGYWTIYAGPMQANVWDSTTTYFAGELVYMTGFTTVYLSTVSGNALEPDTDVTGAWITMSGAPTIAAMNFIYPIGSGPSSDDTSRNVFVLPNGYIRIAPQDPKSGSNSALGAPSGRRYSDWNFENNYFTSADSGPIILRFAADINGTAAFDPMFVEMLASRIAFETCEIITQSVSKQQVLGAEYKKFGSEARIVNAIEKGSEEPAEDDFISCRI